MASQTQIFTSEAKPLELRDYQVTAKNMIRESLKRGNKSICLVASTGYGKTVQSADICQAMIDGGRHILFLAPRRNLVDQTIAAFGKYGIHANTLMSGRDYDAYHPVTVGSIDTVMSRFGKHLPTYTCVEKAEAIFLDELHTYASEKRAEFVNLMRRKGKLIIGMTATPCSTGGGGLRHICDDLIIPITMRELIAQGHLLQPRYFSAARPDLSTVKSDSIDYNQHDLGEVFSDGKIMGDVISNWQRIAPGTSTVVFAPTRANAAELAGRFRAIGVPSAYVDANTPDDERQDIFDKMHTGELLVLCNVGIVSMGTDIPAIQTVVFATATKSVVKWMQGVGRILRPHGEQEHAFVIDHGGMSLNPRLGPVEDITDWSLTDPRTMQERIEKNKQDKKEPKDIACANCGHVFRSSHICPNCGHQMPQQKKAVEFHEATLKEVHRKKPEEKSAEKRNRTVPPAEKGYFYGELLGYAHEKGYKNGWAANQYRSRFGVWPNAYDDAPARIPSATTLEWIRNQQKAWFLKQKFTGLK